MGNSLKLQVDSSKGYATWPAQLDSTDGKHSNSFQIQHSGFKCRNLDAGMVCIKQVHQQVVLVCTDTPVVQGSGIQAPLRLCVPQ